MLNTCILFRKEEETKNELNAAKEIFKVYTNRAAIPAYSIVISRYSCLPYYNELVEDLAYKNSLLINSSKAHKWIADFNYYELLEEFTFKTWKYLDFSYVTAPGPYVVKGLTNSRKHQWNTHMFAENKRAVSEVACNLSNDALIGSQDLIVRKYEPLIKLDEGLNGLPITNEWRIFVFNNNIVNYDFYWKSICPDVVLHKACINLEALKFVQDIIKKINTLDSDVKPMFYVLDIGQKPDGNWILVEINDAQMSGLNSTNAQEFYAQLYLQVYFLEKHKELGNPFKLIGVEK